MPLFHCMMNENRVKSMCYCQITITSRVVKMYANWSSNIFLNTQVQVLHFSRQISETFDILHAFSPRTIYQNSKTFKFFWPALYYRLLLMLTTVLLQLLLLLPPLHVLVLLNVCVLVCLSLASRHWCQCEGSVGLNESIRS